MTASPGPRYYGFVVGGATPAALIGDWLTSLYDQNTLTATGPGDISGNIEIATINLMLQLFGLPSDFHGGFVSGATMSNFTCLATARQWAGKKQGIDIAREGLKQSSITIISATPHSSAVKCLSMLGIGSTQFIQIPLLKGRESADINAMKEILSKTKGPVILISSGGTVNTVDFDDMQSISELKKQYDFWWHVDAAFGGFASCSPKYNHLLSGWENADSISIDCHKWMNVPYDSAVFFTKKIHETIQRAVFQHSNAPYLGNPEEKFGYLNFLPESSRRFRALPAWFALHAYGADGFRQIVENNITQARSLGEKLERSGEFILAAPVLLNVVCFSVKDKQQDAAYMKEFVAALTVRGKVFMTPTVYNGMYSIRAAFVNWRTTEKDVDITLQELKEVKTLMTSS
ncbi:MAG: aspartate aminotransferase family protein [Gemmatimonadaceae bacterium]|nr:aspartate aminotransferase family protein [Chitinophagaceae bacterium]